MSLGSGKQQNPLPIIWVSSIASSGSRQLIFSASTYELLGWKCFLFLSDQHMDV